MPRKAAVQGSQTLKKKVTPGKTSVKRGQSKKKQLLPSTTTVRRGQPRTLVIITILALIIASLPASIPAAIALNHRHTVDALSYERKYGHWQIINLPKAFSINTVHAAMLPTGDVLLVAGSGNNRQNFDTYQDTGMISVLKSIVLDPSTMKAKLVDTPSDLFCGGHAMLQSGNLLIAGGTSGYEQLSDVTQPAGAMIIHNENPDDTVKTFKRGTKFTSPTGKVYESTQTVTLQPATKVDYGHGDVKITHSSTTVFVQAVAASKSYITTKNLHYSIVGLKGSDTHNIYGQGAPMTLAKQNFRGDNKSYEFNPWTEQYVATGSMNVARWYPSLPVLTNGHVLAVSGLDNTGNITNTTEQFNPETKTWTLGNSMAFATYPALFGTQNPDVLFYSGSNAGYGPKNTGRTPGFWNYVTNAFKPVTGLQDPTVTETSDSVVLPPAEGSNNGNQSTSIMIAGGGGIGQSNVATARTDIIDLDSADPHYVPGPNLSSPLRYVNMTITPWDQVFTSGGTRDYRAEHNTYSHIASMIDPTTHKTYPMANELVGRGYHSGTLLLPNGQILAFGNDPLYSDKADTSPGSFEQRIEVYTPPELYDSVRPVVDAKDGMQVHRGQTLTFKATEASAIKTVRLIPPSSVTHVTNLAQRSIAAVVTHANGTITIQIPTNQNTLTDGWYMLFAVNSHGTPSKATMIQIVS
jgi:hypothetical protein